MKLAILFTGLAIFAGAGGDSTDFYYSLIGLPCYNAAINICLSPSVFFTCVLTTSPQFSIFDIFYCPEGINCTTYGCGSTTDTTNSTTLSSTTADNTTTISTTPAVSSTTVSQTSSTTIQTTTSGVTSTTTSIATSTTPAATSTTSAATSTTPAATSTTSAATSTTPAATSTTATTISTTPITTSTTPVATSTAPTATSPTSTATSTTSRRTASTTSSVTSTTPVATSTTPVATSTTPIVTTTTPVVTSTTSLATSTTPISTTTSAATTTTSAITSTTPARTSSASTSTTSTAASTTASSTAASTSTITSSSLTSTTTPQTSTLVSSTTSSITTTASETTTPLTTTTPAPTDCSYNLQKLPDPDDCYTYYICKNTSCGFVKIPKNCGNIYKYDPNLQVCVADYNCPQQNPVINQCSCDNYVYGDPYSDNKYYSCFAVGTVESFFVKHVSCSTDAAFNVTTNTCSDDIKNYDTQGCGSPTGQTIQSHEYCINSDSLNNKPMYLDSPCTRVGLYSDALSCDRYWECRLDNCTNQFTKIPYVCPNKNRYDALLQRCTPNARCPCSNLYNDFNCTKAGVFPDPNCPAFFITCAKIINNIYIPKPLKCNPGSYFNKKLKMCIPRNLPLDCTDDSSEESGSPSDGDNSKDCSDNVKSKDCSKSVKSKDCSNESPSDSNESNRRNVYCSKDNEYYSIKGDCTNYYVCKDGILKRKKCEKYESFCQRKLKCLPKKYADCAKECKGKRCVDN